MSSGILKRQAENKRRRFLYIWDHGSNFFGMPRQISHQEEIHNEIFDYI